MAEDPSLDPYAPREQMLSEPDEDIETTPLSRLFLRVWSVLPEGQEIVDVSPDETVGVALERMAKFDFSQLPVRSGTKVLGVFSYRSLARTATAQIDQMPTTGLRDMPVDWFVEQAVFVGPQAELPELFDLLDSEEAVFVGDESKLHGVLTTVDVLRTLHALAEPFVRLGEIERALREVVRRKLTSEQIRHCARQTLAHHYEGQEDKLPTVLERMTFDELRLLVIDGRNWHLIEPALGRSRDLARAKLKPLPALRNDVFHFRRDLEDADLSTIRTSRQWLLQRLRMLEESTG
jgi:CBS domain-containing protein